MAEIKIEKGIPIPTRPPRPLKYPLDKMEIGDSFFVPNKKRETMRVQITEAQKRLWPKRFTVRAVTGGGVRVWRVVDAEEPGAESKPGGGETLGG